VTLEVTSGEETASSELFSNVVPTVIQGSGKINASGISAGDIGRVVSVASPSNSIRHRWYSCASEPKGGVSWNQVPADCVVVPDSGESNSLFLPKSIDNRYLLVLAEVEGVWLEDGTRGTAVIGYRSSTKKTLPPPIVTGFPSIGPTGFANTAAGGWQPIVRVGQKVGSFSLPQLSPLNTVMVLLEPVSVEEEWLVCKSRRWSFAEPTPRYGGAFIGLACESRFKSSSYPYSILQRNPYFRYTVQSEDTDLYLVSRITFTTPGGTSVRQSEPALIVDRNVKLY